MSKKIALIIIIAACLLALVYVSLTGQQPPPPPLPLTGPGSGPPPGHPPIGPDAGKKVAAPDFTLRSLEGKEVSLSQFKGQAVVINFWSSSCGPCIIEMPSFQKLQNAMAGKPLQILTVTSDPPFLAKKTMEQLKLDLTVLLDPQNQVTRLYGVYFSPETYIIAPDGSVDNRVMGAANWGDGSVVDYLNRLIESSSSPPEQKPPK